MEIVVRRTGGIAGMSRGWRVDTESCADPDGWSALVDGLPHEAPGAAPTPVPDDFEWTITVAQTTVRVPGSRLDGPWAALVQRVRAEGDPT
ncbi:protealysin inhibitor emfourin [Curtobacterium sp. 9128]|uniref:protealysin inhibitor emfourin n=1 Tax=Curtobacterium sp. 9128 TaxID=1793722 RepID=UPI0011A0E1D7|nr:protealysin inhibitor emfourin [Curtobacterium sp. 9128]